MKEGSAVISQAKFIGLALQTILVAAIYETRVSNQFTFKVRLLESLYFSIFSARHCNKFFRIYKSKQLVDPLLLLFALFACFEFLIIFSGRTLFNNSANLLIITLHVAGIICLLTF